MSSIQFLMITLFFAVNLLHTSQRGTQSIARPLGDEYAVGAKGAGCPVSKARHDAPPKQPDIVTGVGAWFVSEDNKIWIQSAKWGAGKTGNKVLSIRPAGATLVVTGTRIDTAATPLRASELQGYATGFTIVDLVFPSGGCWKVVATAKNSKLQFVTQITDEGD